MSTIQRILPWVRMPELLQASDMRMALVVTRREVRDSFRDWRIIIPIILLTLFFPLLMDFTAGRLLSFVSDYGATIIGTRLIPFLLLVVGFFPTSFSLVIALETFVGEKERRSLEPLLATPLTDKQLYLGKLLASVIPPLMASYLGITVYLVGLAVTLDWIPTFELFAQTVIITTVQAVLMVAAAVIVSSQTTSVRAANLLASFIIVPMALLIQFEAVVMFWGNNRGLWWLILALSVATLVLMRMGIHVFNREELLGREIDHIRLGWMARTFWQRFTGSDCKPAADTGARLWPWYRETLQLLANLRQPLMASVIGLVAASLFGFYLAQTYTFPAEAQSALRGVDQVENLAGLESFMGQLPALIFLHNLRVVALAVILGAFSFGIMGFLILMLPWVLISFLTAQLAFADANPLLFLLATIAPHATLELPALMLVAAAALRWQTSLIAPGSERPVSERWLRAGAEFTRVFIAIVVPLLLMAALVESFVTPVIMRLLYGA